MRAGKLAEIPPGAADNAENFAVQRHFENPPGIGRLADEQYLVGRRRDAERIGRADHLGQSRTRWCRAIDRLAGGVRRHVYSKHAEEFAVGIEYLDAPVRAITNIDVVVAINRDGMREIELPRPRSLGPPGLHPIAMAVIFRHA